jgi:hypothetical protein
MYSFFIKICSTKRDTTFIVQTKMIFAKILLSIDFRLGTLLILQFWSQYRNLENTLCGDCTSEL